MSLQFKRVFFIKQMKKNFSLLFILLTIFFFSNIVLAAETFSVKFYDVSTDTELTDSAINWDAEKIVPGKNEWVWSTTYMKIESVDVSAETPVYIYQDNKNGSTYKAEKYRTELDASDNKLHNNYSGLVNKSTGGGQNYKESGGRADDPGFIPLSYLICSKKLETSDFQEEYDPDTQKKIVEHVDVRIPRYFCDKSDNFFDESTESKEGASSFEPRYCILAAQYGPVFWYKAADGKTWTRWSDGDQKTAYVYFGGNFYFANRERVYGTDKIFISTIIE